MARLLLVDNDARIVELTAWFLERRGYEVRSAVSYAAARTRIAEEGPPDLMLADLELGVESGREELPRLSRRGELPPTLVVSGYLDATLTEELTSLPGVLGTLPKPFDMPELEAAIERCLALGAEPGVAELTPALAPDVPPAASSAESSPAGAAPNSPVAEEDEDDDEGWIEILPGALGPTSLPDRRP